MNSCRARGLAGAIALTGAFALIVMTFVFIEMTHALNGGGVLAGVWVTLSFFTILTHLGAVVIFAHVFAGRWPRYWPGQAATLAALMLYLGVVALVYHLALSHLWKPQGLHYVADVLLHGLIPALVTLFWWLYAPKAGLRLQHALWWLVWPLIYLLYVLARGEWDGFYPYPFLHVGQWGLAPVLYNALGLGLAFALCAGVILILAKAKAQKNPP